jgi:hypothetical protein
MKNPSQDEEMLNIQEKTTNIRKSLSEKDQNTQIKILVETTKPLDSSFEGKDNTTSSPPKTPRSKIFFQNILFKDNKYKSKSNNKIENENKPNQNRRKSKSFSTTKKYLEGTNEHDLTTNESNEDGEIE